MADPIDQVKSQIPHREPFLFVDRIVEQSETRIATERLIRADEPHFAGHYPGSPLMPGVLICEACFQTGAILLGHRSAGFQPAQAAGVPPAAAFRTIDPTVFKRTRGYLPHWEREHATYFVTFRLADSLSEAVVERIALERHERTKEAEANGRALTATERDRLDHLYSERVDEWLNAGHGACHMKDDRVAEIVAKAIGHFEGQRYAVYAWAVMPNHVHVVIRPFPEHALSDILHSWKSLTAKACNKLLGRTGEFWQRESFDRLIRDEAEFGKRVQYTLDNPVVAGLTDWKWVGGSAVDGTSTAGAGQRPALREAGEAPALRKPVLTRILEAKFRGMVRPGDLMNVQVDLEEKMGDAFVMNGRVDVAGKNVLRVKFIVAMVEV